METSAAETYKALVASLTEEVSRARAAETSLHTLQSDHTRASLALGHSQTQHKRLQLLRKVMVPDSGAWYVHKIGNMVTINREFQALYSVRELSLAAMLLAPGSSLDGAVQLLRAQNVPAALAEVQALVGLCERLSAFMVGVGHAAGSAEDALSALFGGLRGGAKQSVWRLKEEVRVN